jgi:hypothetical protein
MGDLASMCVLVIRELLEKKGGRKEGKKRRQRICKWRRSMEIMRRYTYSNADCVCLGMF